MINPLYTFIKQYHAKQFGSLRVEAKQTQANKSYYMLLLAAQDQKSFPINNTNVQIKSHHVSVYEKITANEKSGLSAIHYTATLAIGKRDAYVLHVYFDRYGNYQEMQLRDLRQKINRREEFTELKVYALHNVSQVISELTIKAEDKCQEMHDKYMKFESEARELSKRIDFENIDPNDQNFKIYQLKLELCKRSLEAIQAISLQPSNELISHFTNLQSNIQSLIKDTTRDATMTTVETTTKSAVARDKKTSNKESPPTEKKPAHEKKPKDPVTANIKKLKLKLANIENSATTVDRVISKHQALNSLLQCYGNNLDQALTCLHDIRVNLEEAQEAFLYVLMKGQLEQAKRLAKLPGVTANFKHCIMLADIKQTQALQYVIDTFHININYTMPVRASTLNHTLLSTAVVNNDLDTFCLLLRKGASTDINFPMFQSNLLQYLCSSRRFAFVKALLEHVDYDVNAIASEENSNLPIFSNAENAQHIKDVLSRIQYKAASPLMLACESRADDIAQLLLERGAEPNRYDLNKMSALGYCVLTETGQFDEKCLRALLEHGANVNQIQGKPPYETTPLYFNVMKNRQREVEVLLEYGANPNLAVTRSHTLIQQNSRNEQFKSFIPAKITSLHIAVIKNYHEIFTYLMNNSQIDQKNLNIARRIAIHLDRTEFFKQLDITEKERISNPLQLIFSGKQDIQADDSYWLSIP